MTSTLLGTPVRRLLIALCFIAAAMQTAAAGFPDKPIRLVVPFPAGTSTDTIARTLAPHVSANLGQPIVVENKPGADGVIAAAEVKRSPADGYTIMLAPNSPMSGVPAMKKVPPYDVTKDFTPIIDVGRFNFFVYVNSQVPAKTLTELVSYAKANPGKLSYGAGNVTGHLSFASIALTSKIDVTHVPYKGEPPAMIDLIGGRIQAMVATAGTGVPHVQSGKLRALATILHKRSALLPDVPTIREAGFPNLSIEPWVGLFGAANMPKDVVNVLNRAFSDAMKDPAVLKTMAGHDVQLSPSTPEALAALVKRQLEVHREIARAAGIEPD